MKPEVLNVVNDFNIGRNALIAQTDAALLKTKTPAERSQLLTAFSNGLLASYDEFQKRFKEANRRGARKTMKK